MNRLHGINFLIFLSLFLTFSFFTKVIYAKEQNIKYHILKKGKGEKLMRFNSPIIKCKGYFSNGKVFLPKTEFLTCYDELPSYLKEAIVGMKAKEKRKIYIPSSPKNEKDLIFEVELIKIDKDKLIIPMQQKLLQNNYQLYNSKIR